jgi:hypothetical protein
LTNTGELKKRIKQIDNTITSNTDYFMVDAINVNAILDEVKAEFPVSFKKGDGERLKFYDLLINQLTLPKMSEEQQKELLVAAMECSKWFIKWFGES